MKTLFRNSNYGYELLTLEITETEILTRDRKQTNQYSLPHFRSQLETKSHRGFNNLNNLGNITFTPKVCQINLDEADEAKINAAVDISRYQLCDRKAKQRHLDSIRQNLEHRLQVAKAGGNDFLINLLNDEFKQLTTSI